MFVKRGERVTAEAAALRRARHPGVVELVGADEGTLRTRLVDGRPLSELGPLPPEEVAGLAAAVADTLADLHDVGVCHGGVDAGHVIVTPDGRPVLCSLGRDGTPPGDVADLARLVSSLLDDAPPADPVRARVAARLGRRRRLGPMLCPPAGPTLAALVAEAVHPDPDRRPSARAFAGAVRGRIPSARLPRRADAPLRVLPPAPSPLAALTRVLPVVGRATAGVVAVALAVTLVRWAAGRGPEPPGAARPAVDGAGSPTTARAGADGAHTGASTTARAGADGDHASTTAGAGAGGDHTGASTTAGGGHARALATAPRVAEGDHAGGPALATRVWPREPLDFRDGVLNYGGARYAVGQPGDVVAAGDWGCTGMATLALLRPATGAVYRLDAWPDEGGEVEATVVGTVAAATGLRSVDGDGDGCDELEVTRSDGPPVRLELRR